MEPLVSIIIPVYNAEKWLSESIESALNQTYHNKEIIIVDDGSNDNSYNIAKSYESDIIKVFKQSNKGGSSARNYGFGKSNGKFIQYLDADDIIKKEKILKQIEIAKRNPDTIIYSNWAYLKNSKEDVNNFVVSSGQLNIDPKIDLFYQLFVYDKFIASHAFLWPRNIIQEIGPWDESLSRSQDADIFIKAYFNDSKFIFNNNILALYRKDISLNTNISFGTNYNKVISKIKILNNVEYQLTQKNRLIEFKTQLSIKYYTRACEVIWFSAEQGIQCYHKFLYYSNNITKYPNSFNSYIFNRIFLFKKKDLFFDSYLAITKKKFRIRLLNSLKENKFTYAFLNLPYFLFYSLLHLLLKNSSN